VPQELTIEQSLRTAAVSAVHPEMRDGYMLSDYVRFEYDITGGHNAYAGEDMRWLPRRQATGLALPGNDFWLFDGETLLVNHFSGAGDRTATEHVTEHVTDPAVVKLCATAFDAVWNLAVPHAEYTPE
jgi:hypothetical protein